MDSRNEQKSYYVVGNTARKLNTAPQRIERTEREKHSKPVNSRINHNSRQAKEFDLRYTTALVGATVFLFAACVSMLTLQANVTEQRNRVAQLERNVNSLKNENDELHKRIESSVDLTKVYDVAVNELGMVYPKNGQVVSYEASRPDYVKQFKDVPEK